MGKYVRDIMSKDVKTVFPEMPALQAARCMTQNGFRHMVVTDYTGKVVGVFSDRDMVKHFSPWLSGMSSKNGSSGRPPNCDVQEVMIQRPITVTAEKTLSSAAGLLGSKKIGCLPVVDDHNHPVGLLSIVDLLFHMALGDSTPEDDDENDEKIDFYRPPAVFNDKGNLILPTDGLTLPKTEEPIFATIGYKSGSRRVVVKLLTDEQKPGARQVSRTDNGLEIPAEDVLEHFQIKFRGPYEITEDEKSGCFLLSPRERV